MTNEQLIEKVKVYPFLYDTTNKDYCNQALKEGIWCKIAGDLDLSSGEEAKDMWLKLRSCHRESVRRRANKRGRAIKKPWKYEKQMEFLLNYMSLGSRSFGIPADLEPIQKMLEEVDPEEVTIEYCSADDNLHKMEINESNNETTNSALRRIQVKPFARKKLTRAARRQLLVQNNRTGDGLYHFFMSLYSSVQKMPLSSQLKIKRQLFDTVSVEEQLLHSKK